LDKLIESSTGKKTKRRRGRKSKGK